MASFTENLSSSSLTQIIDPSSLSFERILNDLETYIQALPDAERWDSFYAGGHGKTLTELVASLGYFLKYSALMSQRESSISTARLRSSLYAAAQHLGYTVRRTKSPRFTLTLTVSETVNLGYQSIGSLLGIPVSTTAKTVLNPGTTYNLDVVLGSWNSGEVTISVQEDFHQEDFFLDEGVSMDNIDNDLLFIEVNNKIVKHSDNIDTIFANGSEIMLLTNIDHFSVITSPLDGSLGSAWIKGTTGSVIRADYLETSPGSKLLESSEFLLGNLSLDVPNITVTSLDLQSLYVDPDSNKKISILAPRLATAKRRAVTPDDWEAITMSYPGITDARWVYGRCTDSGSLPLPQAQTESDCNLISGSTWTPEGTGCCEANLSYIFEGSPTGDFVLSTVEENLVKDFLEEQSLPVTINLIPPVIKTVVPQISIRVEPDADTTLISNQVRDAFESQSNTLGILYKIGKIIKTISNLDGVISVYMHKPFADYTLQIDEIMTVGSIEIEFVSNLTSELKPDLNPEFFTSALSTDGYV